MIYIRADANDSIATGHMMRCLSIACAIRQFGENCVFIISDQDSAGLIQKEGFQYYCLDSKWDDPDSEIEKILPLLRDTKGGCLLIDSYYVTERYMNCLRGYICTAYIDDLNRFHYPCDILINYSIYAKKFHYEKSYHPATRLVLGTRFVPLRDQFADIGEKRISERLSKVLLLSGGADYLNVLERIIKKLVSDSKMDIQITAVCGALNTNKEVLDKLEKKYKNVRIVWNANAGDMATYMQDADAAISAGGSTLYELCACGTPTISYSFVDNQIDNVLGMQEQGLAPYVGDFRQNEDRCLHEISVILGQWDKDKRYRKSLSDKMRKIVDGKGSRRVAEILLEGTKTNLD